MTADEIDQEYLDALLTYIYALRLPKETLDKVANGVIESRHLCRMTMLNKKRDR